MAVVGSIAWVFLIAVVGVCSVVQVRSDVAVEQKPVILSMPIAAPAIVEMPMELPDNIRGDDLVEAAHVPGIEVPVILLKPNRQPPMNELPPMAIEIKPEPPAAPTPVTPPKRKRPALDTTIFASCDQIGTDIHFMREPLDAFQRAREEKKLVYVMHLSGNLEDKDFT
jgi:hypothetical protein